MAQQQAAVETVRLPPRIQGRLAAALIALSLAAVFGAICSVVPSMAFRSKSGVIRFEYAMSIYIAPALFAAILVVLLRALRPTRKRLMVAAVTMLGASPFLLGIRFVRWGDTMLDIDNQWIFVSPWAVHGYLVCACVLLLGGLMLRAHALRLPADRDVISARAQVVRDTAVSEPMSRE